MLKIALVNKWVPLPLKLCSVSNVRMRTFSSKCTRKDLLKCSKKPKEWRAGLSHVFGKYLIITNTLMCGCLMSLGDLIQQDLRHYLQGKPLHHFDWDRNKKMVIIGLMQGPLMHVFYSAIDKHIPGVDLVTVFKKLLVDQLIGSPMFISTFFFAAGYLDHENFKDIIRELREKFLTVYTVDCMIWIPGQFINFFWLSNKFRVIYVNIVVMCYNVFLSFIKYDM